MLVFNRQPGCGVLFTGGIRVVIVGCSKRGAIIGIEAPDNVGIMREEIAIEARAQETVGAAEDGLSENAHGQQQPSSGTSRGPIADTHTRGRERARAGGIQSRTE